MVMKDSLNAASRHGHLAVSDHASLTALAVSADSDIARLSADAVQIGYRKEIGALRVFGNKEVSSTAMDADAVP